MKSLVTYSSTACEESHHYSQLCEGSTKLINEKMRKSPTKLQTSKRSDDLLNRTSFLKFFFLPVLPLVLISSSPPQPRSSNSPEHNGGHGQTARRWSLKASTPRLSVISHVFKLKFRDLSNPCLPMNDWLNISNLCLKLALKAQRSVKH